MPTCTITATTRFQSGWPGRGTLSVTWYLQHTAADWRLAQSAVETGKTPCSKWYLPPSPAVTTQTQEGRSGQGRCLCTRTHAITGARQTSTACILVKQAAVGGSGEHIPRLGITQHVQCAVASPFRSQAPNPETLTMGSEAPSMNPNTMASEALTLKHCRGK